MVQMLSHLDLLQQAPWSPRRLQMLPRLVQQDLRQMEEEPCSHLLQRHQQDRHHS